MSNYTDPDPQLLPEELVHWQAWLDTYERRREKKRLPTLHRSPDGIYSMEWPDGQRWESASMCVGYTDDLLNQDDLGATLHKVGHPVMIARWAKDTRRLYRRSELTAVAEMADEICTIESTTLSPIVVTWWWECTGSLGAFLKRRGLRRWQQRRPSRIVL